MIHSPALLLGKPAGAIRTSIQLPASKSESNRALIINALTGNRCTLHNLSEARDTQTMQRLLQSSDHTLDVIDAGTTMRFLTAYLAATNQNKMLTGTPRMCERPVAILVDALRQLGADIAYQKNEGFPPLHIKGFQYSGVNQVSIRGDVSSQYISALLMIAPTLPDGLALRLTGHVGSRPYIQMTLQQMAHFGIRSDWQGDTITVPHQTYQPGEFSVESDWSAASYWYSIAALAGEAEIELVGLKKDSLQGDSAIATIAQQAGVQTEYFREGVRLTKSASQHTLAADFTDCPDLAQTVAVLCAAKNVALTLTGVESLKIKETDRIAALQQELAKFGASLQETVPGTYVVSKSATAHNQFSLVRIHTYDDHRMAMAFAPMAILQDVVIEHPHVVVKSYPRFWEDLIKAGFTVKTQ